MALKVLMSKHGREELARHLSDPWFVELLETLRNLAGSSEQVYSGARAISELEHQALNGSFRRGMILIVEKIPDLALDPIEPLKPLPAPFGVMQTETPNPKSLSQQPQQLQR